MVDLTKRNFLMLGAAAVAGVAGIGYAMTGSQGGAAYQHRYLSVDEMRAAGALIVDIRTPQEWRDTGVIEDARLVTFKDADSFLAQLGGELTEGRDLVLVCRSGNRTQAAARALQGRIANPITSVEGGMRKLMAMGYRTVRPG